MTVDVRVDIERQKLLHYKDRKSCRRFNGNKHFFGPLCKQYTAAISSDGSSTLSQQFP